MPKVTRQSEVERVVEELYAQPDLDHLGDSTMEAFARWHIAEKRREIRRARGRTVDFIGGGIDADGNWFMVGPSHARIAKTEEGRVGKVARIVLVARRKPCPRK